MPNMMDYLAAYGESTVEEAPWCALDSLLLANLCYIDPGPLAATREGITLGRLSPRVDLDAQTSLSYRKERGALMHAMAASRRFGDMRLCHYVCVLEPSVPIQFSAVVCLIPGGTTVIAYRGTDNTLTGWREDLYMSFESAVGGAVVPDAGGGAAVRRFDALRAQQGRQPCGLRRRACHAGGAEAHPQRLQLRRARAG